METKAYAYMMQLIDQGYEYPDALYKASTEHNVSENILQDAYDQAFN